jgi:hypothetical protein
VRSLLGVVVVVAIVAAFAFFTVYLPRFRTGEEKLIVARGLVLTTPAQRASGPVTIYVSLFRGRPRRVDPAETPVDDASPDPTRSLTGSGPTSFRFEFEAAPEDGPAFFVRALVETPAFDQFCEDARLPPARVVDERWVDARTGRRLPPLRLSPTEPC